MKDEPVVITPKCKTTNSTSLTVWEKLSKKQMIKCTSPAISVCWQMYAANMNKHGSVLNPCALFFLILKNNHCCSQNILALHISDILEKYLGGLLNKVPLDMICGTSAWKTWYSNQQQALVKMTLIMKLIFATRLELVQLKNYKN